MDFTLTAEQQAVSEAADGVFGSMVDPDRVAGIEASEDRVDAELWSALAAADLLGLAVPVDLGGQGLGLTELCLLLEAQGRCVAPIPLWPTLVLGALPLARWGSAAQASRWLPQVAAGDVFLTAALTGTAESPTGTPRVRAVPEGEGWRLFGTEPAVP